MTYRNMGSGGAQAITMYVYATTVPIDSSKTVARSPPECKQQRRVQHDRHAHLRGNHWMTTPWQAPAVLARRALVTLSACVRR